MSRVLQDFPKHFQWVPMTIGDSTRHTRDMGDGSWSCDPISGEGVLFSADGLRAGKVSYEILVSYRGGLSEISGEICGEAISKNPSLSDVTLKLKNKQRLKLSLTGITGECAEVEIADDESRRVCERLRPFP